MDRRMLIISCLLPLGLAALGGCLFQPREAEPPTTSSVTYLPRTITANIWENCRLALINKDASGWDTALAPNFLYVPDGDTRSAYPGVDWDNWNKASEMGFINRWFTSDITIDADLLNGGAADVTPDGSGGVAEWTVTYFITVTDNPTGSVTRYRARCQLQFQLQGNFWYLAFWRDEQGEEDPENPGSTLETLGRVRGALAP